MHTTDAITNAYAVLDGGIISEALARELIETPREYAMDLYSLANKVRLSVQQKFDACTIINAKSGGCTEDCAFCAQSASHKADIDTYPLLSEEKILEKAREAKASGASAFSIVTSGNGYKTPNREFEKIIAAIRRIRAEVGIAMHVSLGILGDETLRMLKEADVSMIHHNLEAAPSFFPNICTTHTIGERIDTVRRAKALGMAVCSGGIIGLGETPAQRVELAFALKELDVDSIPINVLNAIAGTRVTAAPISIREIINTVAVFRLVNPRMTIKIAAGRETALGDWQGLVFNAGANSMLIGGYLTTCGRSIAADQGLIRSLTGF